MSETKNESHTNAKAPNREVQGYVQPKGKMDRTRTIIYYFTGTGNSLSAARGIASSLGDTELVPLIGLRSQKGPIVPSAERIGFVFPVHRFTVSEVVIEVLPKLDLSSAKYIFIVMTMGGIGNGAVRFATKLVKEKCGRTPDASFALVMPGNFAPMQRPPDGLKRDRQLEKSGRRLEAIIQAISSGKKMRPGWDPLSVALLTLTKGGVERNKGKGDTFYTVDDRCTGCGICNRICPMNNISLDKNVRPVWNHDCTSCAACLNFCPTQAIQMKVMLGTEGRGRYRHPDLRIEDMKEQNGSFSVERKDIIV